MARWFELRLDLPKADLLKKVVGAMDQVAFTDRELAGRLQTASLCLTQEQAVLVSRTEAADAFVVLRIPQLLMSSFQCSDSRNLHINLRNLHDLLKDLDHRTEFDDILFYGVGNAVIEFEIDHVEGVLYRSNLPVLSWNRAGHDQWYLDHDYPVCLGLSSQSFCKIITELGSYGSTVYATLYKHQVRFRVVNFELVVPTERKILETDSDRGFPCEMKFDIQHKRALLNAGTLSETQMIYIRFSDTFTLFRFSVDGLGYILFGRYNHVEANQLI